MRLGYTLTREQWAKIMRYGLDRLSKHVQKLGLRLWDVLYCTNEALGLTYASPLPPLRGETPSERLREARMRCRLTLHDFLEKADLELRDLRHYESGNANLHRLSFSTLIDLARAFETPLEEVVEQILGFPVFDEPFEKTTTVHGVVALDKRTVETQEVAWR